MGLPFTEMFSPPHARIFEKKQCASFLECTLSFLEMLPARTEQVTLIRNSEAPYSVRVRRKSAYSETRSLFSAGNTRTQEENSAVMVRYKSGGLDKLTSGS